jgi:3-phenylpropionate/trans-cinnamate dioxygenase ferredoxin reductase subunit
LSKDVLTGKASAADIRLVGADVLAGLDLELRLGTRATGLDVEARQVTLDGGERIGYDSLVLATGSVPRTLPNPAALAGIHTLRSLADAEAIRGAFARRPRIVIVGGGFIGAEVAASARSLGLEVTIVDPLPALMIRGLGSTLGQAMTELHRRHGVQLRLGIGIEGFVGGGRVEGVRLTDETVLSADLVVVGIGTTPCVEWLAGSGLVIADGIMCNEQLRAVGTTDVYAVGDAARWANPRYPNSIRTEHWTTATEQANAVASVLTGRLGPCDVLPYVWSDQFGARLQVFGHIAPDDQVSFVHGDPESDSFVAVTARDGRMTGAVGRAAVKQLLPLRQQLAAGKPWPSEQAEQAPAAASA